jgi:hypothetical protein
VSVTEVTITDKDCSEIAALAKYFPKATGILCQFHVLKAVDTYLQKCRLLSPEQKNNIRKLFRAAVYAVSEDEFAEAKSQLQQQGMKNKNSFTNIC